MAELTAPQRQKDPDPETEAYLIKRDAELNAQHQELRDQARATLAAVKGHGRVQSEQDWQRICSQARINYESGRFFIEKLGAERYLEPELMATLAQLRLNLLTGIQNPTAADTMMADSAVIAYRNMLRVQGWIDNLCLVVERELFGQEPLNQYHGHTVGKKLTEEIRRLEEVMMPLLERSHRMMAKSFAYLEGRRGKAPTTSVTVAQASQVNVDCAVVNKAG